MAFSAGLIVKSPDIRGGNSVFRSAAIHRFSTRFAMSFSRRGSWTWDSIVRTVTSGTTTLASVRMMPADMAHGGGLSAAMSWNSDRSRMLEAADGPSTCQVILASSPKSAGTSGSYGVIDWHPGTRDARERLCDIEGLRKKQAQSPRSLRNRISVPGTGLVHSPKRIASPLGGPISLGTDPGRIERSRSRAHRVDGGIDAAVGELPGEHDAALGPACVGKQT